jgi:hypothetical protein
MSRYSEYNDTFYFRKFENQLSYPFKNFDLKDGRFSEFIPSDVVHFLCSDRFRALIDENWGSADRYEWFTVDVHNASDVRSYHAPHVLRDPDILDAARSKFAGPSLVVPAFKSLLGHNIFSPPNYAGDVVSVWDSIKRRFAMANCPAWNSARSGPALDPVIEGRRVSSLKAVSCSNTAPGILPRFKRGVPKGKGENFLRVR